MNPPKVGSDAALRSLRLIGDEQASSSPVDLAAERCAVGAALRDESTIPKLEPCHFDHPVYRVIYVEIGRLERAGRAKLPEVLAALGGEIDPQLLGELINEAPRQCHVQSYAERVIERARVRDALAETDAYKSAMLDGDRARAREHLEVLEQAARPTRGFRPVELYGPEIPPRRPEFTVANLIRKVGLMLIWAQPGGYKTSLIMAMIHELMAGDGRETLLGHPDLAIVRPYRRVLLITTEEEPSDLRYLAEAVRSVHGTHDPPKGLFHQFALDASGRLTLDDLPALLEQHGPFDCVVLDSLTGLRPKVVGGERIHWDADNDFANEQCLALRAIATTHQASFWIVHHSDKLVRNYRGPVEWWASADSMMGLLRTDDGKIRVEPQKTRGGQVLPPFILAPEWSDDRLTFTYEGRAPKALPRNATVLLNALTEHGPQSVKDLVELTGISRSTVIDNLGKLSAAGRGERTGEKRDRSPVWTAVEHVFREVTE